MHIWGTQQQPPATQAKPRQRLKQFTTSSWNTSIQSCRMRVARDRILHGLIKWRNTMKEGHFSPTFPLSRALCEGCAHHQTKVSHRTTTSVFGFTSNSPPPVYHCPPHIVWSWHVVERGSMPPPIFFLTHIRYARVFLAMTWWLCIATGFRTLPLLQQPRMCKWLIRAVVRKQQPIKCSVYAAINSRKSI